MTNKLPVLAVALLVSLFSCLLPPRAPVTNIGVESFSYDEHYDLHFVNVRTSQGEYSVTVAHLIDYLESVDPLHRKPRIVAADKDIAVYTKLNDGQSYYLADETPLIGERLTIVSHDNHQLVYLPAVVVGYSPHGVAVASIGYNGMSGSPVFNQQGEIVGSVSSVRLSEFGFSGMTMITDLRTIKVLIAQLDQS